MEYSSMAHLGLGKPSLLGSLHAGLALRRLESLHHLSCRGALEMVRSKYLFLWFTYYYVRGR